jgi:hypothetical protein
MRGDYDDSGLNGARQAGVATEMPVRGRARPVRLGLRPPWKQNPAGSPAPVLPPGNLRHYLRGKMHVKAKWR